MSLVQTELERRGIVTASVTVMPEVTRRLAPPRALVVDASLGAPMGPPHDVMRQLQVLRWLLALLYRDDPPVLDYESDGAAG